MGSNNYFLLMLLLALTGVFLFFMPNSEQSTSSTTDVPKLSVGDVKIEYKSEVETQKTKAAADIETDANVHKVSDLEIHYVLADTVDSSEMEPNGGNANMPAKGEFSDQINLATEIDDCKESCPDNTDVNAPAVGEFADEINSDAIISKALLKYPDTKLDVKLADVPTNSHPPTEINGTVLDSSH